MTKEDKAIGCLAWILAIMLIGEYFWIDHMLNVPVS